jgi:hypothetical protein
MGVMSLILEIANPELCKARMAASRPLPGPFTNTSTWRKP